MRFNIITKYFFREVVPNYFLGLSFLSVIMFVMEIFRLISLIVEKNADLYYVAKLLILYLPLIFQFTIPVSVAIGVVLAVGRLSDDQEIVAMRSCGLSLWKIINPALFFGFLVCIFTIFFYEYIFPYSIKNYIKTKIELRQNNPVSMLSSLMSYESSGVKITVGGINQIYNELEHVRIYYFDDNKIIFAPKAVFLDFDPVREVFPLLIFNSTMQTANMIDEDDREGDLEVFREQFSETQVIYIPVSGIAVAFGDNALSISELYKRIKDNRAIIFLNEFKQINNTLSMNIRYINIKRSRDDFINNNPKPLLKDDIVEYDKKLADLEFKLKKARLTKIRFENQVKYYIEFGYLDNLSYSSYLYHRKLNFAVISFVFSLLAIPFGLFSRRKGKSISIGIAILIIIVFFSLVFLGQFLMQKKILFYFIAAWLPSILLFAFAILFNLYKISGKDKFIFSFLIRYLNVYRYFRN